jgi:hypothetical protein
VGCAMKFLAGRRFFQLPLMVGLSYRTHARVPPRLVEAPKFRAPLATAGAFSLPDFGAVL